MSAPTSPENSRPSDPTSPAMSDPTSAAMSDPASPAMPVPNSPAASSPSAQSASAAHSCDIAVIGGGAGGLAASIALARSLRSVVVIDAGQLRNESSAHAHNVLGNEGMNPRDLIAKGRAEAEEYGVTFVDTTVADVRRLESTDTATGEAHRLNEAAPGHRFELTTSAGAQISARRIIIATGSSDELPDVPGLAEGWGETVLHCPYCHGYEVRGQRIGVIGSTAMSYHQAMLFSQLSNRVTFIRHDAPAPDAQQTAMLESLGIEYVDATVTEVARAGAESVVSLEPADAFAGPDTADYADTADIISTADAATTGTVDAAGTADVAAAGATDAANEVVFDALTVGAYARANAELFTQLGGEVVEHPSGMGSYIPTQMGGQTDVPGVWAVGNGADISAMVVASAASGVLTGAQVNADLIMESLD